jgi:hypothetical protein
LRPLARGVAEQVSLRLVATGELLDSDPDTALAHALIARRLASRVGAVREAVGLAAYRAGQWQTAIGELRAYHRMTGRQTHLAVLADCERALGRPERAIDLYRAADREQMSPHEAVELLIVAAGARADLGQSDAAVTMLQVRELTAEEPWVARLRYAYADALLAAGRPEESREWFARAAEIDEDAQTDAAERLLDLDGVVIEDDEEDIDEYEDEDEDEEYRAEDDLEQREEYDDEEESHEDEDEDEDEDEYEDRAHEDEGEDEDGYEDRAHEDEDDEDLETEDDEDEGEDEGEDEDDEDFEEDDEDEGEDEDDDDFEDDDEGEEDEDEEDEDEEDEDDVENKAETPLPDDYDVEDEDTKGNGQAPGVP